MSWLVPNLLWASALMLLVLAVRKPFARLFGAGPAYALWLLPLLRLLSPPLSWPAVPRLLPPIDLIVETEAAAAASASASAGWTPWLAALWAGGALAFLAWQWLAYRAFLTRLSLSARAIGAHRGLPLVASAAVPGPLALGLLDRRIVVPADFAERYSPDERRLALDHEAVHHRRGDIWWNLAALAMLALNWLNPIAWLAYRAFREDQELACDAAVTARSAAPERHHYARTLVKSASRPGLIAACPLNHADQLKRRLKMMKQHRSNGWLSLAGGATVALAAAAGLTLGSPGIAHPHSDEDGKQRREHRIIVLDKEGGDAGARRELMIRRGADGTLVVPEGCREGGAIADIDESSGDRRTRLLLCSRGGEPASPAEHAERLQRVRDRLARDSELGEEHRARVLAALDREIARLRGQ